MPDLPFKGSIRLRKIQNTVLNQEAIKEETGLPSGEEETYPSDSDLPPPSSDKLINSEDDESILLRSKRGDSNKNNDTLPIDDGSAKAYFVNMCKIEDDSLSYS